MLILFPLTLSVLGSSVSEDQGEVTTKSLKTSYLNQYSNIFIDKSMIHLLVLKEFKMFQDLAMCHS